MKRALVLALLLIATVSALAQQSAHQVGRAGTPTKTGVSQSGTDLSPSQIFSRARPSVVVIVAADQNGQREALGSGFIVSHDRIATNHHVVEGMTEAYVVFSDGSVMPVSKVIADSAQLDLIVLAAETGNRMSVAFGDEMALQQGDSVYALGAPKGLELTFTNGIVSSFRKSDAQFLIQTTAPIAPGSSGGPLFDSAGRVVGVTTSLLADAPGIYFSVGIGDVKRLLRTAGGVALPLAEWAKQQAEGHNPESPGAVASNETQGEQAATPSLQDTLSWMQSFSQAHGLAMRNGKFVSKNIFFPDPIHQKPSAAGCAVWTAEDWYDVKPNQVSASVEFFNLSDINPNSVEADEYGNLQFETTDPSGKIDYTHTFDPSITSVKIFSPEAWANGHTVEGLSWTGWLSFDSAENAQRFATAFKHSVILCGGTKSSF